MTIVAVFQTFTLINKILIVTPQIITSRMFEASQEMATRDQVEGPWYS